MITSHVAIGQRVLVRLMTLVCVVRRRAALPDGMGGATLGPMTTRPVRGHLSANTSSPASVAGRMAVTGQYTLSVPPGSDVQIDDQISAAGGVYRVVSMPPLQPLSLVQRIGLDATTEVPWL